MESEIDYRRVIMSSIIIGLVVGALSSIPILRWPNLCCLWIILGGFGAAYVSGRDVRMLETVEAGIVGAVFGLVYGFVVNFGTFFVNIVLNLLGLGVAARGVAGGGLLNTLGIRLGMGMIGGLTIAVFTVLEGVIFGAVGGILYAVSKGSEEQVLLESSRVKGKKTSLSKR